MLWNYKRGINKESINNLYYKILYSKNKQLLLKNKIRSGILKNIIIYLDYAFADPLDFSQGFLIYNIMELDKNYRIESDTYNFTLIYESKSFDEKKRKEVTSKDEWYYPDLKLALNKYVNQSLKPCQDALSILDKLNEIELLISNLNKK